MGAEAQAHCGPEQVRVREVRLIKLAGDLVRGGRDDLGEAEGVGGGLGVGVEEALLADQGQEEERREAVALRLLLR